MAKKKDDLYNEIARVVLKSAVPYLAGWIETLGEVGKTPKGGKDAVPAQVRVAAAKHGTEFVSKFIGSAEASEAGAALLKELQKVEDVPSGPADDDTPADADGEDEE